jgi:hypothetical protein
MTPQQINIAITKGCGWTNLAQGSDQGMVYLVGQKPGTRYRREIPNYHGSLDAMREAKKTLTVAEKELMMCHLVDKINPSRIEGYDPEWDGAPTLTWHGLAQVVEASSAQLAEAFLRTKGLWI